MMFWLLLSGGVGLALIGIVWGLDRVQDGRPTGVSATDWQRVSEERERARLNRVVGKQS